MPKSPLNPDWNCLRSPWIVINLNGHESYIKQLRPAKIFTPLLVFSLKILFMKGNRTNNRYIIKLGCWYATRESFATCQQWRNFSKDDLYHKPDCWVMLFDIAADSTTLIKGDE